MKINDIDPIKWNNIFGDNFTPESVEVYVMQLQGHGLQLTCRIHEKDISFPSKIKTKKDVNRITFSISVSKIKKLSATPPFSGPANIFFEKKENIHLMISFDNSVGIDILSEYISLHDIKMDYYDIENEGI